MRPRSPSKVDLKQTLNSGAIEHRIGPPGLNFTPLIDPLNKEPLIRFCRRFNCADHNKHIDDLGLELGRQFNPKLLGLIGYAAINAATLGACLRTLTDYLPIEVISSKIEQDEIAQIARLRYQTTLDAFSDHRQALEFFLGLFYNVFETCLGKDWRATEILLAHSLPQEKAKKLTQTFRTTVRGGHSTNAIAFPISQLEKTIVGADQHLAEFLEDAYKQQRQVQDKTVAFVNEIREHIRAHLGQDNPTLEDIAHDMGVSKWTLRSKLRARGLQFANVVTSTRKELAHAYLSDPNLPLTQIALMLSYSELSAFSRAFRQWTGSTPQQYRKMLSTSN